MFSLFQFVKKIHFYNITKTQISIKHKGYLNGLDGNKFVFVGEDMFVMFYLGS